MKDLSLLSSTPEKDFFDSQVVIIVDNTFSELLKLYADWLAEEAKKPKKKIEEIIEDDDVEPVIKEEGATVEEVKEDVNE